MNFLGPDFELERDHKLTPSESRELCGASDKAKVALRTGPYAFSMVVEEFETSVRISQLFDRAISEIEFAEIVSKIEKELEKSSPQKRAQAHGLIRNFADTTRPLFGEQVRQWIEKIPQTRSRFNLLADMQRFFGNDYERFIDFLGDLVAFNPDEELLRKLSTWADHLKSIIKLFEQANSAPLEQRERAQRELGESLLGDTQRPCERERTIDLHASESNRAFATSPTGATQADRQRTTLANTSGRRHNPGARSLGEA